MREEALDKIPAHAGVDVSDIAGFLMFVCRDICIHRGDVVNCCMVKVNQNVSRMLHIRETRTGFHISHPLALESSSESQTSRGRRIQLDPAGHARE